MKDTPIFTPFKSIGIKISTTQFTCSTPNLCSFQVFSPTYAFSIFALVAIESISQSWHDIRKRKKRENNIEAATTGRLSTNSASWQGYLGN